MSEPMNRMDALFAGKKSRVLNMYFTAGYPHLNSTLEVLEALQANGADMVELGMPYSDPLADGPVIQQSNMVALNNGMSISVLFEQLATIRTTIHLPIVLMGYLNPVLQFGIEKFAAAAASVGIDGLILPDLPLYEFENEYKAIFDRYGLRFIFLVTPETPIERIIQLDRLSSGFLYAVSSSSTTGTTGDAVDKVAYLKKLQTLSLKNPVLVGFGIKDAASFDEACTYTNGAIIGTAYIKALEKTVNIDADTAQFVKSILTV